MLSTVIFLVSCVKDVVTEDHSQTIITQSYLESEPALTPIKVGQIHTTLAEELCEYLEDWNNIGVPENAQEIVFSELLITRQSTESGIPEESLVQMYDSLFGLNLATVSDWSIHDILFTRPVDSLLFEDIITLVEEWYQLTQFQNQLGYLLNNYSQYYSTFHLEAIRSATVSSYGYWKDNFEECAGSLIESRIDPKARAIIGGDIKGAIWGGIMGGLAGALLGANGGTLMGILDVIIFG